MMKIRKKMIISFIVIAFIGMNQVKAHEFGVDYADTGGGSYGTPRDDVVIEIHNIVGDIETKTYNCTYNYQISVNKTITINGYNYEGTPILENSLIIKESDRVLSGTSIGLNMYETKTITWEVTKAKVTYTRKVKKPIYQCTYTNIETDSEGDSPQRVNNSENVSVKPLNSVSSKQNIQSIAQNCSRHNQRIIGGYCPSYDNCEKTRTFVGYTRERYTVDENRETTQYKKECEDTAAAAAKIAAEGYQGPSYIIELSDSNDINGTNTVSTTVKSKLIDSNEETQKGYKTYEYTYKQNKVCMNTLTAKVVYRSSDCQENEIEIKNTIKSNREFWHYFVPLNTKSDQKAEINMLPANGGQLVFRQCLYVMQNNPVAEGKTSYVDLIEKTDGSNFLGDFYKGEAASDDYKSINKSGPACVLTSRVKINAVQEFYKEIEKSNINNLNEGESKYKFQGFKFYYKPIDINNPFPNGLASTSIWNDWNASTQKSPDLTKSFDKDEITYIAENINAKKVREYADKINDKPEEVAVNLYADWEKTMYKTGVSKFIQHEGIVTRKVDLKSFYKLGCGPANANWEECKKQ